MSRKLPDRINLLAYPWMWAQVLQYVLNPRVRDGNLRLLRRFSPTHVQLATECPESHQDVEDSQFAALRSILTLGYRDSLIKFEPYHDRMVTGGTPITVDIDAQGDLILKDGGHRILFLLVSGAKEIWATVGTRSPTWLRFVEEADSIANGFHYAQIPHPDFDDCPTARTETRVPLVYEAIRDLGIASAVDLGACSGAFACDLSAIVPVVHGIEHNPAFVALAKWRARKTGSPATFALGSLLDYDGDAELVCTLSVLHHVIKANGLPAVDAWLRDLRCRYLLIEYPTPDESILRDSPEGQEFAHRLAGNRAGAAAQAGFRLAVDLGPDAGFGAVARRLQLWERVDVLGGGTR